VITKITSGPRSRFARLAAREVSTVPPSHPDPTPLPMQSCDRQIPLDTDSVGITSAGPNTLHSFLVVVQKLRLPESARIRASSWQGNNCFSSTVFGLPRWMHSE
jgi:hypothetical protein